MIDPLNIKAIDYSYKDGVMTISLLKATVYNGINKNEIKMKCSFDKFEHYTKKWLQIKIQ